MKMINGYIKAAAALLLALLPVIESRGQDENYVLEETMLDPQGSSRISTWQVYDGLGRPSLTATNGLGDGSKYVYTYQNYDANGRPWKQWLPVVGGTERQTAGEADITGMSQILYRQGDYALSASIYDALGRQTFRTIPGASWKGKGTATEYVTNGDDDVRWYLAPLDKVSLVKNGYYPAGSLQGVRTTDSDGRTTTVFTDGLGRKVLVRRSGYDTYFVYNDLDQLRYVLSPQYQKSGQKGQQGYEYRYDSRGNVVKKILPHCGYIRYWYDRENRPYLMQDSLLREKGCRRFTLYDALGRRAIEGLCSSCSISRDMDACVTLSTGSQGIGGTFYIATRTGVDITGVQIEKAYYYDNYAFLRTSLGGRFPENAFRADSTCGQTTGTITQASDGQYLYSVYSYDNKGRIKEILTRSLDGMLESEARSYTLTGNEAAGTYRLTGKDGVILTAGISNQYGKANDKLSATVLSLSVCGGASATVQTAGYHYDDLGRLTRVDRIGMAGAAAYGYDLHGWPTHISGKAFREELMYADACGVSGMTPRYNGSIGAIRWKDAGYAKYRGYTFTYDALDRLTHAAYGEDYDLTVNTNRYDEEVREYDLNGNIVRLKRRGKKNNNVYGTIDDLKMSLEGNQTVGVHEYADGLTYSGAMDFPKSPDKDSYFRRRYNGNGALTEDEARGISLIEYDAWGNPRRIQFDNGNVTEYVFTATGTKLRTVHYTAVPNISVPAGTTHRLSTSEILSKDSTDYHGNLIVENGKPDKYLFAGGFASLRNSADGKPEIAFHYYDQDHLGNNRAVVSARTGAVEQITNYYPFGMPYTDQTAVNPDFQKYKYNGKELDKMHGLNTYDYGARQYYSIVPAWDRIDPMCEKYYDISPYAYCGNNPVSFLDFNGCDSIWAENGKYVGRNSSTAGVVYVVSGATKRAVAKATSSGLPYDGPCVNPEDVAVIPTGETFEAVKKSRQETIEHKRENGGCQLEDGSIQYWKEGPSPNLFYYKGEIRGARAGITPYTDLDGNDITPQQGVAYFWHIHPNTQLQYNDITYPLGNSTPSDADLRMSLDYHVAQGQCFVVGTRDNRVQYYYNGKMGISVSWKVFNKLALTIR